MQLSTRSGFYFISGDIIRFEYDDGRVSEFPLLHTEDVIYIDGVRDYRRVR